MNSAALQPSTIPGTPSLSQLLPPQNGTDRYFRIQPSLSASQKAMDNIQPANLNELKAIADKTVAEQSAIIDQICRQLKG